MSWPKRPRTVWTRQSDLIQQWVARSDWAGSEGRCRGWGGGTSMSFAEQRLYSHEHGGRIVELARFVRTPTGRTVMLIAYDDNVFGVTQHGWRQMECVYYWNHIIPATIQRIKMPIGRLDDAGATEQWHVGRIAEAAEKWRRARQNKSWRFEQLTGRLAERRIWEQAFGRAVTPVEPGIQALIVAQKLGSGR